MAIDDNTSYELTGYQVKDLAQKIRGKADDDVFVGAGTSVAGSRGLVPAPAAGDNTKFLKGDGTWQSLADNYSTTEQNTGSTWIDGKPIYKKTIRQTFSSIPASGLSWNHSIANISSIVKTEVLFNLGWDTNAWGDASYLGRAGLGVRATTTQLALDATSASNWSGTLYCTIYYTKTTD